MNAIPRIFWVMGVLLLVVPIFGSDLPKIHASMPEGPSDSPVRRALLIGIGDYQVLPDLPGAHNDIALIQHVLTERFGFTPNNVEVLMDSAATRAGILQALNRLVEESGERDMIYFHYSGHGSQIQDLNGDEQDDQLDETIVPADGRTPGIPDITDDELEEYFGRLKTPHAVLVFDSCHSGTVTRGVAIHTRSVPPDTRMALYRQRSPRTRGVVPLLSQRYVLMTGAAANQPALDGPIHGNYHGFFTYSLFQSLIATPLNATTQVVFGKLQAELGDLKNNLGRTFMPEPQLEAPQARLNQPLFALSSSEAKVSGKRLNNNQLAWFKVRSEGDGNPRLLGGGSEGGLGTVWALYPPNTKSFSPDKAMAYGMTVNRRGGDAIVRVEPVDVSIPDDSRAVVLATPPGTGKIRVQFRDVPSQQKSQLEEALHQQLSELQVVQPNEATQYVIDMRDDQIRVLSGDGLEEVAAFPKSEDGDRSDRLAAFFSRSLYVNELLALENPSSHIRLNAKIVQAANRATSLVNDEVQLEAVTVNIRRKGETRSFSNSLQVEFQTNVDCYVTIVDIDAEGTINVLFPNDYQKPAFYTDGFIKRGTKALIPDSLAKKNHAGFHWDFVEPAGMETIKFFATTDLKVARKIRRQLKLLNSKMVTASRGNASVSATVTTGLRKLRQDLVKALTRGILTVPDDEVEKSLKNGWEFSSGINFPTTLKETLEASVPKGFTQETTFDWTAVLLTVRIQP